jgi:hypothetical protein
MRTLYARSTAITRADAGATRVASGWFPPPGEKRGIFGFECGERRIEHIPTRYDDDVEAADVLPSPE